MTYILSSFQMTNEYLEESNNTCTDKKNQFLHLESCIRKRAYLPIPKNHHLFNLAKIHLKQQSEYILTIKSKSIQFLLKNQSPKTQNLTSKSHTNLARKSVSVI